MSKTKEATEKNKSNPLLNDNESEVVETKTTEEEVSESNNQKTGSKTQNIVNEMSSDIAITKAKLAKEPEVHFMIPLVAGESSNAVHDCFINGYKFSVPKGVMTIVPQSVAAMLAESYKVQAEAGKEFRLDLNQDKLDNLTG